MVAKAVFMPPKVPRRASARSFMLFKSKFPVTTSWVFATATLIRVKDSAEEAEDGQGGGDVAGGGTEAAEVLVGEAFQRFAG